MKFVGTVKLKKVTLGDAIYALSIPGAQTANLYVPALEGEIPGIEGTVTVDIPKGKKAVVKEEKVVPQSATTNYRDEEEVVNARRESIALNPEGEEVTINSKGETVAINPRGETAPLNPEKEVKGEKVAAKVPESYLAPKKAVKAAPKKGKK